MGRVGRLLESPLLYDFVQASVGVGEVRRRVRPHVEPFAGSRVLDVGAGTGGFVGVVPSPAAYVALDLDPGKLARLAERHAGVETVLGDATELDLEPGSFDNALAIFLTHHLDDAGLDRFLAGLARAVSGAVVLVDPLPGRALRSRALWAIDRGSYPRPAEAILAAVERRFRVAHAERFRVVHEYLLCVAGPAGG